MAKWDADSMTPGGPTSEEVLLSWLQTPGNRDRWQLESRMLLSEEIVEELKVHGITRTNKGVRHKVAWMVTKCKSIVKWLTSIEQYDLYHSGAATQKVNNGVLRRFRHYDRLAPLFGSVDGSDSQAQKRPNSGEDGTQTKKKRTAATTTSALQASSSTEPLVADQVDLPPVPIARTFAQHSTQEQTTTDSAFGMYLQRTSGLYDVHDPKHVAFLGKEDKQRLVDCEIQRQENLAKCQVEGEQRRDEIRTLREKLISRHDCLNAGISEEVVNKVLPL